MISSNPKVVRLAGGRGVNAIFLGMACVVSFLLFGLLVGTPRALAETASLSASLNVRIENVSSRGGTMRLGLYTEETYYKNSAKAVVALDLPATCPAQDVEFADVPPGIYAVQVLQDLNGDGRMDFNWAGLPVEPYGFSRDARPDVARPSFSRVKIALNAGKNSLTIHLQNSEKRPASEAKLIP